MNKRLAAISALEERLGYVFTDRALLDQALTHPSVGQGSRKIANNQVLEFLGDRVLSLLVAEALVAADPQWREGELSRRQVMLVSGASCAAVARGLGIGPALRLDGSLLGGRENDRVLGDAMEAVVAATYIDGGLTAARALFHLAWKAPLAAALQEFDVDSKTKLNEWAMARGLAAPKYTTVGRIGSPHAPTFTVQVAVEGHMPAKGIGQTIRATEQAAAEAFLARENDI